MPVLHHVVGDALALPTSWFMMSYPPSPFFVQNNKPGLCRGGAFYECRMNKWGDRIVGCRMYCGSHFPKLSPWWLVTSSNMRKCRFEETVPSDDGVGPIPFLLPPFRPPYFGNLEPQQEWLGYWPWNDMDGPDEGGFVIGPVRPGLGLPIMPHEWNRKQDWTETKICCYSPYRKCLRLDNPNVQIRQLPAAVLELAASAAAPSDVRELESASRIRAGGSRRPPDRGSRGKQGGHVWFAFL